MGICLCRTPSNLHVHTYGACMYNHPNWSLVATAPYQNAENGSPFSTIFFSCKNSLSSNYKFVDTDWDEGPI